MPLSVVYRIWKPGPEAQPFWASRNIESYTQPPAGSVPACQVAPPSVVRSVVPSKTDQPRLWFMKNEPPRPGVNDQVLPLSLVWYTPPSELAMPLLASKNWMVATSLGRRRNDQVLPPSVVLK